MKIKSFGSITALFVGILIGILISTSSIGLNNVFAEPSVIVDQQCLDDGQNQYFISIQSAGFDFNFLNQEMAIFLDDNFEWSYGDGIGLTSTGLYPPFFGLGDHTALIFVEETGGPPQNHQLDDGEQFATATFTTIDCDGPTEVFKSVGDCISAVNNAERLNLISNMNSSELKKLCQQQDFDDVSNELETAGCDNFCKVGQDS